MKQVDKKILHQSKWLSLKEITYIDHHEKNQRWETVERTTRHEDCDAVGICAFVKKQADSPKSEWKVIVIKQYRPPLDKICIELPAGLIDANESAEDAACRELLEETGYRGKVFGSTPVMANDPGLTNANLKLVFMNVLLNEDGNDSPVPNNQEEECIETELVPLTYLLSYLKEKEKEGYAIDTRVTCLAYGFSI